MTERKKTDPAAVEPPRSAPAPEASGRPDELPTEQPTRSEHAEPRSFHGWRLLGVIFLVILVIAVISAAVDWWVIGPLEGRAPWL